MKKTLFILLAIMALCALLIVPASAEEAHTGHCVCGGTYDGCDHADIEGDWIAWDGTTNITAGGNYYLTAPITTQRWLNLYNATNTDRIVINLCLNGISCDSAYRVFGIGKNVTVNLMNCSETTSVLKGDCSTNDNGKVIHVHQATAILNMYGNIRLEGKTTSGRTTVGGGAVYVSGQFNMYGGEIVGAPVGGINTTDSTKLHNGLGGAVYINGGGVWNMYGGTVTGGSGGRYGTAKVVDGVAQCRSLGGVAYIANNGKWNMYGGEVFGGSVGDGAVFYITGANARFNMTGGIIHAGDAAFGGGVAKLANSSVTTISGGLIDGLNESVVYNSTKNSGGAGGGALMVDTGSSLIVNGTAEIRDCVTSNLGGAIKVMNATATLTLGGSAKVHSNGVGKYLNNYNNNIHLIDGMKPIIVEDTLTSDAYFGISMNTPGVFTGAVTAEQAKAFHGDTGLVSQNEDGTLSLSAAAHANHCACGGASEFCEEHAGLTWTAYTGGNITASGNYYLTNDVVGSQIQIGKNGAEPITVNICFNGNDIVNDGFRAFIIWNNATVNFSNCKGESGGNVLTRGPKEGATDHTGIMMLSGTANIYENVTFSCYGTQLITGPGGFSVYGGATLNLYGGTIDGAKGKEGGSVLVYGGGTFNMYDGLVYGGTSVGNHGGNFRILENGKANFYGGIVRDGVVLAADGATGDALDKNGGNLSMLSGSVVNITGDTQFIGGTANRGGSIFLHKGTLNISGNAKIIGGKATNVQYAFGANGIHVNTTNLSGAVLTLAGTPEIDDVRLNGAYIVDKGMEPGVKVTLHRMQNGPLTDAYISEDVAAGFTYADPFVETPNRAMYYTRTGLYAGVVEGAHYHCLCASTNGEHSEGCDGIPVYFEAWNGQGDLVAQNGGYYLTADASKWQSWIGATSTGNFDSADEDTYADIWGVDRDGDGVAESGFEVSICMNGHNRTSNGRCYGVGSGSIFNLVNCSSEGGQNIAAGANNTHAGAVLSHGKNHVIRLIGNVSFSRSESTNVVTNAGLLYLEAGDKLIIDGASLYGGNANNFGGAVYLYNAEMVMYDGTIVGATTKMGGSIYASNVSSVTIYDGNISGGIATSAGGNVWVTGNSTFNMYGGVIENGIAQGKNDHGGNLYMHNGSQGEILGGIIRDGQSVGTGDANGGNIAMSDTDNNGDLVTLTIGGDAQILGGLAYRGANVFFHSGILTVKDNAVINAGTVHEEGHNPDTTVVGYKNPGLVLNNTVGNSYNPEGIIILQGQPQIADLFMNGPVMDASGLEAGASIGLDCNFAGKVTTTAISDDAAAAFTFLADNGMALYNSDYALLLITPGNDVLVDGESMPIEAAVMACEAEGKYITLSKDLNGEIGITGNATIDLAGYNISGEIKVADGCALSVFDSSNTSLTQAAEGYGKIDAKIAGTLNRSMNTPAAYGHNYKFIAVKEADGSYSFHRIYMTVKSVVFTPYDTGVNFKTVLKCNDVVAKYVAVNGYGIRINGYNYAYNAAPVSGNENLKIVKVKNVLGTADMLNIEKAQADAETVVNAQAMIKLTDGAVIYSAQNGKTLLELVTMANEKFAELTDRQQAALGSMYQTFEALMGNWDDATVGNIRGYQNADPEEGAVFHCYCYGTDAADVATACAEAGHPEVKWLPWNRTNTVPSYSGNYYLTADVTVYGTSYLQQDALVAIDLNGHTITSAAWNNPDDTTDQTNIFYLNNNNSALIITDSVGGGTIIPSGDTNWQTGLGMAVRIANVNSSFSLYAGTINATDVVADYGVSVWNAGTFNMYGGAITGGISGQGSGSIVYATGKFNMYGGVISDGQQLDPLTTTRNTRGGGNVRLHDCQFNMYGGTIENGYAVANGGNIRIAGNSVFNMYGGTIKNGVADNYGGNIFMADSAQINISGGSIEGGHALRGGNIIMLNTSKLTMTDGTIKGGYVSQTGGSIRAEGTSEITISGGKVTGITADELAAIPVGEEENPITAAAVNGGLFFLENSSKLTVSGKANITGGIAASYGGTAYLNGSSVMNINGGTINGGAARFGGAIASTAKATINMTAGTLNGGYANPENTATKGGTIYMQSADVYVEDVLKTDNETVFNMTGGTIYGGEAYNGAVIYAREESTINMSAGTIYAGKAARGGGAAKIEAGCVFNMSGTAVIDGANPYLEEGTVHCGNNGGGVFVDSAVLNMSGDSIIQNCIAGKKGGGIMTNNDAAKTLGCQVSLSGNAQVINNASASTVTSAGAGIIVNNSQCVVNVSGNVQVTGNYDAYGMSSDIAVASGAAVTVNGNLSSGACIGIYNIDPVFANGAYATADNAAYFYSNIDPDAVASASNNQLSFAASFLVGYAVAEISPTSDGTVYGDLMEGIKLTGYGNQDERIATSVDEDLGLKASVLIITGLDGETICIVSYDAGGNNAGFYKPAARLITEKTGIPADHIMFNANHQHSTPTSGDAEYNALFAENVSNAAVDAMAARAKTAMYGGTVNVNAGLTYSQHFNYVRNYKMLNSAGNFIGMITDNHSDSGRVSDFKKLVAESMADDEVQLVKFVREGASTIIMANFQTHPHLLTSSESTVVTSDIVGVFRNELKAALEGADGSGTEYEVMYINGAAGNINPCGNSGSYSTDSSDTSKAWAKSSSYATNLAHAQLLPSRTYAAMSAANFWTSLSTGEVSTTNTVASYQKMLNSALSWTGKTVEQVVAAAKEIQQNGYTSTYRDNYGIYSKYHANSIVTRENNKVGDMYDIYLGAFAIGDLAFVSAPYEMFDTNGVQIKEGSPFAMTFINSLSTLGSNTAYSGHIGYIPSAQGYSNGGYSADISYVAAGTGEELVADFLELLNSLK